MHLQSLPRRMNATTRPRAHRQSLHRLHPRSTARHLVADFANTQPTAPSIQAGKQAQEDAPRARQPVLGAINLYLVAYVVVFCVTLTVVLFTTDLTLALDVVVLVAANRCGAHPSWAPRCCWRPGGAPVIATAGTERQRRNKNRRPCPRPLA